MRRKQDLRVFQKRSWAIGEKNVVDFSFTYCALKGWRYRKKRKDYGVRTIHRNARKKGRKEDEGM